MGGSPVNLEIIGDVLARVLQLVLVQDDVEHLRWTLGQLLGGHHLHVQVARLRLASRFDQPLKHLVRLQTKELTLIAIKFYLVYFYYL